MARATSGDSQVGGKRDLSPLPRLWLSQACRKEGSGDKSLFPTREFLMIGETNQVLPTDRDNPSRPNSRLSRVGCGKSEGSLQYGD